MYTFGFISGEASMVGRGELPDGGLGGFCLRRGNLALLLGLLPLEKEESEVKLLLGMLGIVDPA